MEFYALVEEWSDPDECIAFFRTLPGCVVSAPTVHEAIGQAPGAIAEYIRWLHQHRVFFLAEEVSSIIVVVKEVLQAESVGPRFTSDLFAPTDQDIEHAIQVAATAQELLARLYNDVAPACRKRTVTPGDWSLTDHLEHVLRADAHYVGCLSDQAPEALPPVPEPELASRLIEHGRAGPTRPSCEG